MRHRMLPWLGVVIILVMVAYYVWGYRAPINVEVAPVAQVYPSQVLTVLNATGYVVAQRKAAVASKATGRLEWLGVREGSVVRQGEIIARLENRDVVAQREQAAAGIRVAQANLEQAQAEANEAERALRRSADLLARNFVSAAAHDAVVGRQERARAVIHGQQAAIAMAQANHRAAEVAVEQTLIRAPFEGVVLTKNANVGDVITPFSSALGSQAAVVTMADMSTLEVEADVSEGNLGKVTLEQPCEIQLDALPDMRFRGVLHRLVPTVDRAKATVTAKIRFVDHDARILPEMSTRVSFLSAAVESSQLKPRTATPLTAVVERAGRSVVFAVRGKIVTEVAVSLGARYGELVEITHGLAPGERIVVKPADRLHDGAAVTVVAR